MNLCPTCKASFSGGEQFCPRDGTPLRPSLPEDPLAGRVLSGRYRLIEVLGRGGMGAVYRAHHILMDKPVAVKVLRQELASDTEAVARFHREARSASRLDHENIIRVSDFGQTDDGLLFLVMELLDGENLAQVLRNGALPWRRAAAVAREIALGLGHAHEQGVIHRDLKPENIVLGRRGKARLGMTVKVLDFGLAKLSALAPQSDAKGDKESFDGAESQDVDVALQSLTRTGVVFGTPEYMSPEQAEGRPLDARTDLYALGVVSYQMLSGRLPFTASTFLALIAKTVNEPPPPLSLADSATVPPELEALVLQCLAKSPDDRPQSAEEIADTLESLLARHPEEPLRSAEVPSPPASPVSGRPAGGVARTVQRHLAPGQTPLAGPRTGPRESAPLRTSGSAAATLDARFEVHAETNSAAAKEALLPPAPSPQDLADSEVPLKVPRQPYWFLAVLLCGLIGAGIYFTKARLWPLGKPPISAPAENEPLRRARELLSGSPVSAPQIAEALRILRDEREVRSTPELHRLMSRAYEAENNRLRALGHLYNAVRLSKKGYEAALSQVALAELLFRYNHPQAACQAASKALAESGSVDVSTRQKAEALVAAWHCADRNQ